MRKFIFIFLLLPFFVFAQEPDVSATGCFIRQNENFSLRVRMQSFACQITVINNLTSSYNYNFTLYNLDPDYFTVQENENELAATRTFGELSFSLAVAPQESRTINIVPWIEEDDNFYFVALGDPQSRYSTFEDIANQIAVVNPPFALIAGDIVANSNNNEADQRAEYDEFEDILAELPTMYLLAPGNHDGQKFSAMTNWLYVFREYFGNTYYDFVFGNTQFFALSAEEEGEEGKISGDQFNWLQTELQENYTNKVAFFHRPLVLPSWSTATSFTDESNRQEVLQLLSNNSVELVFNGHIHTYDKQEIAPGLTQIISGNAGYRARNEDYYHFILAGVSGENINHSVIKKDEFATTVDYLGNNDGTEDEVTATITNSGTVDLPYLRLKFLLNAGDDFYAYDDSGNSLELSQYKFYDYSVIYLETSISALQTKTIAVKRATKIHQGRTNLIKTNGEIEYSVDPTSSDTELANFTVIPSDDLQLTIVEWGEVMSWQENSDAIEVLYEIDGLEEGRRYVIRQDGEIIGRYVAGVGGTLVFSLVGNGTRTISVEKDRAIFPSAIFTLPASGGKGHVRSFSQNGEAETSFFADNNVGSFQSIWLDINGDGALEMATLSNKTIRVFFPWGEELTTEKKIKTEVYLQKGDFDGDKKDELVVIPQTEKKRIKIYQLGTNKLKLLAKFKRGNKEIAIGDLDDNGRDELVLNNYQKLKIFRWKENKLSFIKQIKVVAKKIALGDLDGDGQKEIIAQTAENLQIYRLLGGKFSLWQKKKLTRSLDLILASDLTGDSRDEIIVSTNSRVYIYRLKKSLFLVKVLRGFRGGSELGLFDGDGDWDLELAIAQKTGGSKIKVFNKYTKISQFSAYASDFTGGVNLTKI